MDVTAFVAAADQPLIFCKCTAPCIAIASRGGDLRARVDLPYIQRLVRRRGDRHPPIPTHRHPIEAISAGRGRCEVRATSPLPRLSTSGQHGKLASPLIGVRVSHSCGRSWGQNRQDGLLSYGCRSDSTSGVLPASTFQKATTPWRCHGNACQVGQTLCFLGTVDSGPVGLCLASWTLSSASTENSMYFPKVCFR